MDTPHQQEGEAVLVRHQCVPRLPCDAYERHMKRWIEEGDRAAMLQLLRNHRVASYFCKGGHTDLEPYSLWHGDLVGTYDIVFVSVDSTRPQTPSDFPAISRAVPAGTLTVASKLLVSNGRRCVYGTIQHVAASNSGRGLRGEGDLQEMTIEFRQAPIQVQGDTKFVVTKINDQEVTSEGNRKNMVTSYGILTQPGIFGWTPIECKLEFEEDKEYIEFMQQQLAQRYYGYYNWKEEHSWLCQHMGLPLEAALAIHQFNYHPLPKPYWSWQPGDLLLSVRLDEAKSCTTVYFARPRDPARLLQKIRDRYPHVIDSDTDTEVSDGGSQTASDNETVVEQGSNNWEKEDDHSLYCKRPRHD